MVSTASPASCDGRVANFRLPVEEAVPGRRPSFINPGLLTY